MNPLVLVLTDLWPTSDAWNVANTQAQSVAQQCGPILGFQPDIQLASIDLDHHPLAPCLESGQLGQQLVSYASGGGDLVFILPGMLEFNLLHKQALVEAVREARRGFPGLSVHYDDPDPCHKFVVQALVEAAWKLCAGTDLSPNRLGVLLLAGGNGDPQSRAKTYQLMRLVWEQLAFSKAEVAFVRHPRPSLPEMLEACSRLPLHWLVVPQVLWPCQTIDYANVVIDDFHRAHPDIKSFALAESLANHPAITAWLSERLTTLWQEYRQKAIARVPSQKHANPERESCVHGPEASCSMDILPKPLGSDLAYGPGVIAEICDNTGFTSLLDHFGIVGEWIFVKVTWHGYATGTFTDAVALDKLLGALPGRAVLLEGHTSSRNLGDRDLDWEEEALQNRVWIKEQENEFLRRTGLSEVIAKHRAQVVNVTEAYWDQECASAEEILKILSDKGVTLHYPEIAGYVPKLLMEHQGAPFVSFARFKGPTRLCISNCFGLLPQPLRARWHGSNIADFARVCCDVARLYGCLFRAFGLAEALHVAVRWDRKGLYRSRWGNYDLVPSPGIITLSEGLAGADVLASRLQGQDVRKSAFYGVVREELGLPEEAVALPIEGNLGRIFV